MRSLLLITFGFLWPIFAFPQNSPSGAITGVVKDEETHASLSAASISLLHATDSSNTSIIAFTNDKGSFQMKNVPNGNYRILFRYIGYRQFLRPEVIVINDQNLNIGEIFLKKTGLLLSMIEVNANKPPVTLKKDTIEFNASFYKTRETSAMEELVKKIPGMEVSSDGGLKYNGVAVKSILVEGKPYFGDDPKIAMKNLLAGMIEKIQVVERRPDNDDAIPGHTVQTERVVNISIKKDYQNKVNGLIAVAYGTEDRYSIKTALNRFKPHQQLSLIINGNNNNGTLENLGTAGGNGNSRNWNSGLNFNQDFSRRLKFDGSYFFNQISTTTLTNSTRQNIFADSSTFYKQNAKSINSLDFHTLPMNIKVDLDSLSSISLRNIITLQSTKNTNSTDYETSDSKDKLLNSGFMQNNTKSNTNIYYTALNYAKRFRKPGHQLNIGLLYNADNFKQLAYNQSGTNFFEPGGDKVIDSIKQHTYQTLTNRTVQLNMDYYHPIIGSFLLDLSYIYMDRNSVSNKSVFDYDAPTGTYNRYNDSLSLHFNSKLISQLGSIGIRRNSKKNNYSIGINIVSNAQSSRMINIRDPFRQHSVIFSPYGRLNLLPDAKHRLHFDYARNIQPPDALTLLPVIDNSNPLFIQMGNSKLKPSKSDIFNLEYSMISGKKQQNYSINASGGLIQDKIANSVTTDSMGRQLSKPINVDGAYYGILYFTAGIPIGTFKAYLNTTTTVGFNRDMNSTGGIISKINRSTISQGIRFNYTGEKILAFRTYACVSYNSIKYFMQPQNNTNYIDYTFSLDDDLTLPVGFVISTSINYVLNTGRAQGYNMDNLIVNASISKSIMRNDKGLFKLQVYDLLDRNINQQRNIGESYIEDTRTNPLKRFILFSFTYYFKNSNVTR